jgi:hypothetical protein
MQVTGSCHCGALKFKAVVDPQSIAICHCTDCQIMTGSAFRTVAPVPPENFELLEGSPKFYEKDGDSGNRRALAFCDKCSTQIYAMNANPPSGNLGLRLGTLDQRAELPPGVQIWCQSKLDWLGAIDSLPGVDRQ